MLFIFILLILAILVSLLNLASFAIVRANARVIEESSENTGFYLKYAQKVLAHSEKYLLFIETINFIFVALIGATISCTVFNEVYADKQTGFLIAIILLVFVTAISMYFSQVVKAFALNAPERILFLVSVPLCFFYKFFYLFTVAIRKVVAFSLSKLDLKPVYERELNFEAEDFGVLAERSARAGKLEEDEGELIQGVVKFSDTLVQEVMTPRMDIISVTRDSTIEHAIEVFTKEGVSRLLVVGDELDEVYGILIAKDLIHLIGKSDVSISIRDYIREVHTCNANLNIDDLLEEFKKNAVHFSVVLDEHGGVTGIITLEDVVEEIVGEIFDEHDSPEDEQEVTEVSSKEYIIDGGSLVTDINSEYDFNIPEGEYDTIAGYILSELEEIPEPNAKLTLDNITIEVLKVEANRIVEVRVIRY